MWEPYIHSAYGMYETGDGVKQKGSK